MSSKFHCLPLSPVVAEISFLKMQCRITILTDYLLLKWGHCDCRIKGILKIVTRTCEKSLMKLVYRSSKFWSVYLANRYSVTILITLLEIILKITQITVLAKGSAKASSEAVIVPFNADSHQDPPLTPFFPSRPITTQESYKAHKGEVWSVTHVEVCYSCKELISLIYVDSNMRNICGYWGWGTMVERI